MTFNFTTQLPLRHLLLISMKKKLECKDHQVYSKMLRRFVKRKSNLRINISYMYMVKIFLKIIWSRFLAPRSEHLLASSATLSCKTQNILTLSMLAYYNTNSFFLKSFSLMQ